MFYCLHVISDVFHTTQLDLESTTKKKKKYYYYDYILLTCEGESGGKDDVYSCTVDVKHDAEVDGYTAQHRKTVDERPVGGIQRDLRGNTGDRAMRKVKAYHLFCKIPILFTFTHA